MQHDLALELGVPLSALARMTEREFRSWARYARQKPLPTQRIENAIGLLALIVSRIAGGGKDSTLADFVLDYRASAKPKKKAAEAAMTLGDFAGVGVRKLGQKRKAK